MKILYIYRNPVFGFSIERVFRPIEDVLKKEIVIDSVYTPTKRALPHCLLIDLLYIAWFLVKGHYDIVQFTGGCHHLLYLKPICNLLRIKVILTVHDLGFYDKNNHSLLNRLNYILFVIPVKFAEQIVFISESSKKEALGLLSLPEKKICVIPDPYDPSFIYHKHELRSEKPVVLHVGTHIRKNLIGTAKALKGFPCHLRIIGEIPEVQRAALEENRIDYSVRMNLTNEQLIEEYINCDIVNFPSLYEGFGLPIIEAQAIGRPVLTSNIAPMCNVAGDNAVLVDPYSSDSILKGYNYIMANYNDLVVSGLNNAKKYEASTIASYYSNLYRKIK